MVEFFGFDVPAYVGGGIAAIVIIALLFWIFSRYSGRIGEEKKEEIQTERLEEDENKAENAQKDEKKVCVKMEKIINEIRDILKNSGMGDVYNQILKEAVSIKNMLWRMREEKMNVEWAIETFKTLHASLNEFINLLPKSNKSINTLVEQLIYYQKREYDDLITELKMDEDKKATLRKLWAEVNVEENGSGTAKAA